MAKQSAQRKITKEKINGIFQVFKEGKTYRNLIYLFVLLPMGFISFLAAFVTLFVSIIFIIVPITAIFSPITMGSSQITDPVAKIFISLFFFFLGIGLMTLSLHILNFLADIYRRILGALE